MKLNRRGFSILSVISSLAVMSISMSAMLMLLQNSINSQTTSNQTAEIERLKNRLSLLYAQGESCQNAFQDHHGSPITFDGTIANINKIALVTTSAHQIPIIQVNDKYVGDLKVESIEMAMQPGAAPLNIPSDAGAQIQYPVFLNIKFSRNTLESQLIPIQRSIPLVVQTLASTNFILTCATTTANTTRTVCEELGGTFDLNDQKCSFQNPGLTLGKCVPGQYTQGFDENGQIICKNFVLTGPPVPPILVWH